MLRGIDRELEEASPHLAEELGVAGRQEAVRALARVSVLDPLTGKRLAHFPRGLLSREDERDASSEHALEDRPNQRVVRAAEDDRVRAGLLERRRVLANRCRRLLAEGVVALDQRYEPMTCDGDDMDAGVERANELR